MVDGRADDREPERDVHALDGVPCAPLAVKAEAEHLGGYVPLVVVHADDDVVPPAVHLGEDAVGRQGPAGVDPLGARGLDRRDDLLDLLGPKEPVLTGVRVEAGNGDARSLDAEVAAGPPRETNHLEHAGRAHALARARTPP